MLRFTEGVFNEFLEMSALKKKRSKLPVNLYLDDTGSYKKSGHWKRIKFQGDHGDTTNFQNLITMSISDSPEIFPKNIKIKIPVKEIEQVKQFVIKNAKLLSDLADEKIDIEDFIKNMRTS
jgi:hypothetical protein